VFVCAGVVATAAAAADTLEGLGRDREAGQYVMMHESMGNLSRKDQFVA
jgi:hypothetical protein